MPETVRRAAGAVPPRQLLLTRVTLRVCSPLSPRQIPAGLAPLQGPVVQRQAGRVQSLLPYTVRLALGRLPPAHGWLIAVTVRLCDTVRVLHTPAALGDQEPVLYRQVGGGQYFEP